MQSGCMITFVSNPPGGTGALNGTASLDVPVSAAGLYTVQVANLGTGPLTIWSAATPQLALG